MIDFLCKICDWIEFSTINVVLQQDRLRLYNECVQKSGHSCFYSMVEAFTQDIEFFFFLIYSDTK